MIVAIFVATALAAFTYQFVERPLRYRVMSTRRIVIAYLAAPIIGIFCLVGVGRASTNFLFLYPAAFRAVYAQSTDADWVGGRGLRCWDQRGVSSDADCSVGEPGGQKAVLWGDSHAYHFVYFFRALGTEFGYSIHDLSRPACPPFEDIPDGPRRMDSICRKYNKSVMEYLVANPSIGTVFMSATWSSYLGATDGSGDVRFKPGQAAIELRATISKLQEAGKKIVLLDDVAPIPEMLVNCQLYNRLAWQPERRSCEYPASEATATLEANRTLLSEAISALPTVQIIHTYGVTCQDGECGVSFEDVPLYRNNDSTHLNLAGGASYYKLYRRRNPGEIERILGRRTIR